MTDYTANTIEVKRPSANLALCDICEQWQEKKLLSSHLVWHCSNALSSIEAAKPPPPQAIQPTKLQRCVGIGSELRLEPANEQTTSPPGRSPYCDMGKKYNRACQIASHKSKIAAAEKLLAAAAAAATTAAAAAAATTNSPAQARSADVTASNADYVTVGRPAPPPVPTSSPATYVTRRAPTRSLVIHNSPQLAVAPSTQASSEHEVYCTTCDQYITQSIKSHRKRSKKHRSLVAAIRAERSRFYCHVCKSLLPVDDMASHISSRSHLARVTGGRN